jgi:hypothetical protein
MKIKKLDMRGFSHDIMLVLFLVIFAISGVAYMVGSHADSLTLNAEDAAAINIPTLMPDTSSYSLGQVIVDHKVIQGYACKFAASNSVWRVEGAFTIAAQASPYKAKEWTARITNSAPNPLRKQWISTFNNANPPRAVVSLNVSQTGNNSLTFAVYSPTNKVPVTPLLNGRGLGASRLPTCPNAPPVTAPTKLAVSQLKASSALLSWNSGKAGYESVGHYILFFQDRTANVARTPVSVKGNSYKFTGGLQAGHHYSFQLVTVSHSGKRSTESASRTFTTPAAKTPASAASAAPAAKNPGIVSFNPPTGLTTNAVTANSITFSWVKPSITSNEKIVGYDIIYESVAGNTGEGKTNGSTSYTFTNLFSNMGYHITVQSIIEYGSHQYLSKPSATLTATTQ